MHAGDKILDTLSTAVYVSPQGSYKLIFRPFRNSIQYQVETHGITFVRNILLYWQPFLSSFMITEIPKQPSTSPRLGRHTFCTEPRMLEFYEPKVQDVKTTNYRMTTAQSYYGKVENIQLQVRWDVIVPYFEGGIPGSYAGLRV